MKSIELINASAGSGKTYNLTNRVVNILQTGMAPEALMATTFTNRAAAELRERIRMQLLKNGQRDEANRIYDGFIGTVNSICARLLQEYALDAGLSPALDIMPEEDSQRLFKIAIDSVINQYAGQLEPSAWRLGLDGSGYGFQKLPDWRDDVKTIVDQARSNQIPPATLRECARSSWDSLHKVLGPALDKAPDEELKPAISLAINHLASLGKRTQAADRALNTLQQCERAMQGRGLRWADWMSLAKASTGKKEADIIAPVNILADQALRHPGFQADAKNIIDGVFNCAIQALESYEQYKTGHGLMDFADQESQVLELATGNAAFRASLSERLQVLMVDEFQDTSPIQLALFLAFHHLAGQSVWVGDPKQAIYGFRGTDPQLMEEMIRLIDRVSNLEYSWRSREELVKFSNALFERVFSSMGAEKVCLQIPEARAHQASGGWLEAWHLLGKNLDQDAAGVANGVRDLLERKPGLAPGDIAVLCRTNDQSRNIAACLEQIGVRASVAQGSLADTRECQLALAALRYMNDPRDTVALAEIVHFAPSHSAHQDWLLELLAEPAASQKQWRLDPLIASLDEGRRRMRHWTPLEALEQAMDRVDLVATVKAWPNPRLAMSNLDSLRGSCVKYIDQCKARRSAATVAGFINCLKDSPPPQAEGSGPQTVQILTYHGSKGLEWPVVILTGLGARLKADVFGVHIESAPVFDPVAPLANRSIRYWPQLLGGHKSYDRLDEVIDRLDVKKAALEQSLRENQRLLYVGMTRARDGLVMAMRKTNNSRGAKLNIEWLDTLVDSTGQAAVDWPLDTGSQLLAVGRATVEIEAVEYDDQDLGLPGLMPDMPQYLPICTPSSLNPLPARIAPSDLSAVKAGIDGFNLETVIRFDERIGIKGQPPMDDLGSAIHGFLATDYQGLKSSEQLELATSILRRWRVEPYVPAADLVAAGLRLQEYIDRCYPGHRRLCEWPVTLRNEQGQLMQGWIDMLLELPEGYVIIDHKSYPGPEAQERARKYAPQLRAYKEAVEKATGRPVVAMLLHLPVSGQILRLA